VSYAISELGKVEGRQAVVLVSSDMPGHGFRRDSPGTRGSGRVDGDYQTAACWLLARRFAQIDPITALS
jgi:hypothetical protein